MTNHMDAVNEYRRQIGILKGYIEELDKHIASGKPLMVGMCGKLRDKCLIYLEYRLRCLDELNYNASPRTYFLKKLQII